MSHAKKGHRVISMDILEHLQKLYPALTKKQKTIADYLIANPEEISYITLAQLSHQTGTSELTLLRFCQKLGYSNFLDLKEQFRDYTQKMIKQASSSSFFCRSASQAKPPNENGSFMKSAIQRLPFSLILLLTSIWNL